jgi:hypothetical protein
MLEDSVSKMIDGKTKVDIEDILNRRGRVGTIALFEYIWPKVQQAILDWDSMDDEGIIL